MIDFYKYISKISNKNKFFFVIIIIISIICIRKINIKLNHIMGILFGLIICIYTNSFYNNIELNKEDHYNLKKKRINIYDDTDDHFIDNDLSVFSDDFSHDSHNTHSSSSCSGFILFDSDTDSPSFSTFDSDSGACNWGTDMSLNSENF